MEADRISNRYNKELLEVIRLRKVKNYDFAAHSVSFRERMLISDCMSYQIVSKIYE